MRLYNYTEESRQDSLYILDVPYTEYEDEESHPLNPIRPTITFPADNSESFTYDLNTNLLTISHKGKDDTGSYRVVDVGNQFVDV